MWGVERACHSGQHRSLQSACVTQEIAWTVKGGRAECSINGAVVAAYDKAQLVGPGKLQSTDGVYGVRFSHNVEAVITGFAMSKN